MGELPEKKIKGFEMKKVIFLVTVVFLLVMSAVFAGCGGSNKAVENGSAKGISEAELGVPIYPGKIEKEDSGADWTMQGPGSSAPGPDSSRPDRNPQSSAPGQMSTRMTVLWTPDSADKVASWYKEKLSGKTGFSEASFPFRSSADAGGATKTYTFKSGDTTKMVMIRKDTQDYRGGTTIAISDAPQGMPSGPAANQGS